MRLSPGTLRDPYIVLSYSKQRRRAATALKICSFSGLRSSLLRPERARSCGLLTYKQWSAMLSQSKHWSGSHRVGRTCSAAPGMYVYVVPDPCPPFSMKNKKIVVYNLMWPWCNLQKPEQKEFVSCSTNNTCSILEVYESFLLTSKFFFSWLLFLFRTQV